MKEIFRITFGLTVSCLIAALVMGTVFVFTDEAKKNNEHLNVQKTMLDLLGYGPTNPAPAHLEFHTIYRYILEKQESKFLGYLVPVTKTKQQAHELLILNLNGECVRTFELAITEANATQAAERDLLLEKVLEPAFSFVYQDSAIIADLDHRRLAYLLPGKFPGFKTFISVMLAVDASFQIIGLEIVAHEEDPGLGGEIEQRYFKNQFRGKSFKQIQNLDVIKEPLPDEFRQYLENQNQSGGFDHSEYQNEHIYSLTGATISSKSVTNGVRNIVDKFAYRIRLVDQVIVDQNIPTAFARKESSFGSNQ